MRERIIGYILLAFSVVVIIGTAVNTYFVFIGKARPVNVFGSLGMLDLLPGIESTPNQADNTNLGESLNIFAHLFLMGFIGSAAFKVGRLGVMMIRPIKVNLAREEKSGKTR